MFDVRLLQTLVAVAEHKSFARAAQALHATQPGVSQQVARLETHFGTKLFTRGGGSVELTQAGATILVRARNVLAAVARLESEAQALSRGYAGTLGIGLSSSIVASDLPSRLRAFKRDWPRFRLDVSVKSADELFPLLDTGALDALLTTLPPRESEYLSHHVADQVLGVALPLDHPLSRRRSVRIDELFDERFIVVPRSRHRAVHDQLIARFENAGRTLDIAAEEVAFPSVLARVALGDGVGLVPAQMGADPGNGVVIVPLDDSLTLPIRYIVRRDSANPAAQALLEHIMRPAQQEETP
ncbi:LysR family transcriptional regulator [Nonomuraea longicatena]|uniref:LysR family transcriptional regulator n=1 Tax=Nonomuraea longicatena TaxID=83682 RepID=A0ABP4BMA7_9ACTN